MKLINKISIRVEELIEIYKDKRKEAQKDNNVEIESYLDDILQELYDLTEIIENK